MILQPSCNNSQHIQNMSVCLWVSALSAKDSKYLSICYGTLQSVDRSSWEYFDKLAIINLEPKKRIIDGCVQFCCNCMKGLILDTPVPPCCLENPKRAARYLPRIGIPLFYPHFRSNRPVILVDLLVPACVLSTILAK